MDKLPFVIWMIGYPLVSTIGTMAYIMGKRMIDDPPPKAADLAFVEFIRGCVWIYVGYLIWGA